MQSVVEWNQSCTLALTPSCWDRLVLHDFFSSRSYTDVLISTCDIKILFRQCSECDQASSDDADIAMETLPDGTKRSRRQIKGPIKFIPQEMSPEPKKPQVRATVCGDKLQILNAISTTWLLSTNSQNILSEHSQNLTLSNHRCDDNHNNRCLTA